MISAVVFDAFGTMLDILKKLHPFGQLLKEGIVYDRRPRPDASTSRLPRGLVVHSGHGLPDTTELSHSGMAAVRDFFDGLSMEEACTVHSAKKDIVERVVRLSGARFAGTLALSGVAAKIHTASHAGDEPVLP